MKDIRKKTIIIVIILLIILLCLVGIFTFSIKKTDKDKTKHSSTELDGNLYSKYYFDIMDVTNTFDLYLSDKYPFDNIDNISDKEKTQFLLDSMCNIDKEKVTLEELEKKGKVYFNNYKPFKEMIKNSNGKTLYEFKNNTYIFKASYGKDYFINFMPVEDKAYTDRWIVKRKIYYLEVEKSDEAYKLKVYNSKENVGTGKVLGEFSNDFFALKEEDYKSVESSLKTVTYTYKRIDDNYYIQSIKIN